MTQSNKSMPKLEYHTNQESQDAPFHYELVESGDEDGSIVFGEIYDEDHAAAIVMAVNCHDALVKIAQAARIFFPPSWQSTIETALENADFLP